MLEEKIKNLKKGILKSRDCWMSKKITEICHTCCLYWFLQDAREYHPQTLPLVCSQGFQVGEVASMPDQKIRLLFDNESN